MKTNLTYRIELCDDPYRNSESTEWTDEVRDLARACGYAGPDDAASSYNEFDDDKLTGLLEDELENGGQS